MVGPEGDNELGEPNQNPDRIGLRALLREQRHVELTKYIEGWQVAFERDPRKESWPIAAFDAFASADPQLTKEIDAWVTAQPDSYVALAARAQSWHSMAWQARGGKLAGETPPEALAEMKRLEKLAEADALRALELRPRLVAMHVLLLEIYGASAPELREPLLAKALKACPGCRSVRETFLAYLRPRWGGSVEEMAAFAARTPAGEPRLQSLLGAAAWERCTVSGAKIEESLVSCREALSHGRTARYLETEARLLLAKQDYPAALADYDEAIVRVGRRADLLAQRAQVLALLGRWDEAKRDAIEAFWLDPVDAKVLASLQTTASYVRAAGYKLYQEKAYVEAIALFDRAAELDTRDAETLFWRAMARAKLKEHDAVLADLVAAVQLEPGYYDATRGLDAELARRGRFAEIAAAWTRYLEGRPDDARAIFERCGTYFHMRKLAEAKADCEKACELGLGEACRQAKKLNGSGAPRP